MVEDVRTYARLQLQIGGMVRAEYVQAVRSYAVSKYGSGAEVVMHAERTARHLWDSRR
jgi:hypothetical protein